MNDRLVIALSELVFPPSTHGIRIPFRNTTGDVRWTLTERMTGDSVASGVASEDSLNSALVMLPASVTAAPGYHVLSATSGTRTTSVPFIIAATLPTENRAGGVTMFPHSDETEPSRERKETPPETLAVMRALGLDDVLDTLPWSVIERRRGVYTFSHWTDEVVQCCRDEGMQLTLRFMQNNPLYNGGDASHAGLTRPPQSESELAGFAAFVLAALRRYDGAVRAIEVWNEFNAASFNSTWWPHADARSFFPLLRSVRAAVKREFPIVRVMGAGVVGTGIATRGEFWGQFIDEGGLDLCDAISAHPYEQSPRRMRALMTALNDKIREKTGGTHPVEFTEVGWSHVTPDPTTGNGAWVRSEFAQAIALVHVFVVAREFENVERVFWYNVVDSWLDDPGGVENNFGLLRLRGESSDADRPKLSAWAFAVMRGELAGFVFDSARTLDQAGLAVDVYRFVSGERIRLVAWTTPPDDGAYPDALRGAQPGDGALVVTASALVEPGEHVAAVRDIFGVAVPTGPKLRLSFTPVYIDVVAT